MGEPKMWNISKTADCRMKRTKSWVSGYSEHSEVLLTCLSNV